MRNKFVYSCGVKIHASGFDELLESIFCLLLVVEVFSLQKNCRDAWRMVVGWHEVGWIWRKGQNFVAPSFNFWSVDCVTCSWVLLWRKLGPFCWPLWAAGIAVFRISNRFAEYTSQMSWFRQNSESYSGSYWQQIAKQQPWPFSGVSLALESALKLLLGPPTELVFTSCIKSTFCHMSQSGCEIVCCCCVQ